MSKRFQMVAGEFSVGEKLGGGGGSPNILEGAKANARKSNVTMNPAMVFILLFLLLMKRNCEPREALKQVISVLHYCNDRRDRLQILALIAGISGA